MQRPTIVLLGILALSPLLPFACSTDTPTEPGSDVSTVTDIDGNVYRTVTIGHQVWLAENLKVTHYRNGDPIDYVTDGAAWGSRYTGAYCNYNNDTSGVSTYGRLYNWYAVFDDRNVAPAGWHVPSDSEWKVLEMALGMSQAEADAAGHRGTTEGGKIKETGTTHWLAPNTGATNESGFTALPGGFRGNDGYTWIYYGIGNFAYFWTSSEDGSTSAWDRSVVGTSSVLNRVGDARNCGLSVRCVKDPPHGRGTDAIGSRVVLPHWP